MKRHLAGWITILNLVLVLSINTSSAQNRIQSGVLECLTKPTFGAIIGSVREMNCVFKMANGLSENYVGVQGRIGIDVGVQAGAVLLWAVYAPTSGYRPGDLAGVYSGSSADVAAGLGVGVSLLLGGSKNTFALQPLAVQGQAGVNLAYGIASLKLTFVP